MREPSVAPAIIGGKVGPIEHAVLQISIKVEKDFKDFVFAEQIRNIASYISEIEIAPDDWESNINIKKIEEISTKIQEDST